MTNKYLAFFDVDGTVINIKSMFSFLEYYLGQVSNAGALKYSLYKLNTALAEKSGQPRERINEKYYEHFSQARMGDVMEVGKQWWKSISHFPNLFNHQIVEEIKHHQRKGAEIILVSGSMQPCVKPIADSLGINHCLLTSLEVVDGFYTGKITDYPNIGLGKRKKIQKFMSDYSDAVNLSECFAYGDHITDLPMLKMVGHPVAVGGSVELAHAARKRGWKVIH